ncbi:diguanylate cyclase [Marinobacteraceae bacterium S3BR75-40.1]
MTPFKRLSIRYKLIFVVLLTATIGIAIAATAFLSYDQVKQRKTLANEMRILSQVIAMRSAVALSFGDTRNALANLETLNIRKNIRLACMYNESGDVFVRTSPRQTSTACPAVPLQSAQRLKMTPDYLDVWQDIRRNNQVIGQVFVRVGLEELYERIRQQVLVSISTLVFSLILAFLLTMRLQRRIYEPISQLGWVASQVTHKNNYSIRAQTENEDELGEAVNAFNEMLDEIEADKHRMYELAYYDQLTKLPNRRMFSEQIEALLNRDRKPGDDRIAVMFLDLDKFKDVNDTLGHDIGDLLLKEFAQRIARSIPEYATAYRLGGDEFTVIQKALASEQEAITTAQILLKALEDPALIQGHTLEMSCSIGIAIADHNDTTYSAMKRADIALYQAKDAGRGHYRLLRTKD